MYRSKVPIRAAIVFACLFALVVAGCSRGNGEQTKANSGGSSIGEYQGKALAQIPVIHTFKFPDDFRIDQTQADIIKQWGQPRDTKIQQINSPVDKNTKDERTELVYDGFSFLFYHLKQQDKVLLVGTTISDPRYEVSDGLRVGMYKTVLLKKLGEPTFVQDNSYVYSAGLDSKDKISKEFIIPGDTVQKIIIYPEIP